MSINYIDRKYIDSSSYYEFPLPGPQEITQNLFIDDLDMFIQGLGST